MTYLAEAVADPSIDGAGVGAEPDRGRGGGNEEEFRVRGQCCKLAITDTADTVLCSKHHYYFQLSMNVLYVDHLIFDVKF